MKQKSFILALSVCCISLILFSCKNGGGSSVRFAKDYSSVLVKIGSVKRFAQIRIPKYLQFNLADKNESYDVVFVLHGANRDSSLIRESSDFDNYSDKYNFIFVYPDGLGGRWESLSDNLFFSMVMDALSEKFTVRSFYFTGHSAGAIKCFEVAGALFPRVAAIAPVNGLMNKSLIEEAYPPVDVFHIYSLNDTEVPPEGIEGLGFLSVKDELDFLQSISDRENAGRDIKKYVYETQGHVWNKNNAALITDFFYNHPARKSRALISIQNDRQIVLTDTEISAECKITNPAEVSSVNIMLNNSTVYSAEFTEAEKCPSKIPFTFTAPYQGLFHLLAELKLSSGETICSTLNPFIVSIKTYADSPGAELSLVNPVECFAQSIESSGLIPNKCIDGNFLTRYSSDFYDRQFLIFDFAKEVELSAILMFWEMAYARDYKVLISSDSQNWTEVYNAVNHSGGTEIINFEPAKCRYVKLNLEKRATPYGFSLWEVLFLK